MKRMLIVAAFLLMGGGMAFAALTEADLAPEAIVRAVSAQPAANRAAYARQVLQAIGASPAADEAKTQALTSAARALITGAGADQGAAIISEIYNTVPLENLQGVADLLAANGFGQAENGFTDAQYDDFCANVVRTASSYIASSGTDSPAVRMSILAATFTKGSSDPERTRPQVIAALPAGYQTSAATYVAASEQGNRDVLAAATGVNEVAATPDDPDAGAIVPAPAPTVEAKTDYLEEGSPEPDAAPAEGEEGGVEAKVPLLARYATDVLGITLDTMADATYSWATGAPRPATLVGVPVVEEDSIDHLGAVDRWPGSPIPRPVLPSPSYGNQYID